MSSKQKTPSESVGRLKQLGPEKRAQTPLLLPWRWDDLTTLWVNFAYLNSVPEGEQVTVKGRVCAAPENRFQGTPRMIVKLEDNEGTRVGTTFFGDTRGINIRQGDEVIIQGKSRPREGITWLDSPEIIDPVWEGCLRPVYSGKSRVIRPETVRAHILGWLNDEIPNAAAFIDQAVRAHPEGEKIFREFGINGIADIKQLLKNCHLPETVEEAERAQSVLEHLAATARLAEVREESLPGRSRVFDIRPSLVREVVAQLPFTLDMEQKQAIKDAVLALNSDTPMRHLISGDVGSGKTAVFACTAACCIKQGGRVALLAPTGPLALQSLHDILEWWPEIAGELVTSDTNNDSARIHSASLLAGSTALLHCDPGEFDLIIVDEQQRFSREQRQGLMKTGSEHLIEATATCIPRSMALLKFGHWSVSRLHGNHTEKTIHTEIRRRKQAPKEESRRLMQDIKSTVDSGYQVIVVYPARETAEAEGDNAAREYEKNRRQSVSGAGEIFEEQFPGQVRTLDGRRPQAEKQEVLASMQRGDFSILVATTLVEVGLNIPNLRRCVVVSPERMGLTSLHQIRGRVARNGGVGYFDLYVMGELAGHSLKRLEALKKTNDGFELTEMDMELRGVGDLSSDSQRQSGSDNTFLFGRPLSPAALQGVAAITGKTASQMQEEEGHENKV